MYSQLTLVSKKQEFSKIGNKVFIPTGVQTYFQRLNRLKYILSQWSLETNASSRSKHVVIKINNFAKKRFREITKCNRKNVNDTEMMSGILFLTKALGTIHPRPANGLRVWPRFEREKRLAKGWDKEKGRDFATLPGKNKEENPSHHTHKP